jgi:hypothetical protein
LTKTVNLNKSLALKLDNDLKRCRFEAAEQRKIHRLQQNTQPSCSMYRNT